MWGLQLQIDATSVLDLAREQGLLVNRTDETVIRMLPPLNVDVADIDRAVGMLDQVLASVAVGASA